MGIWIHDGVLFYFYRSIIITEIYPTHADIRGGTKVTIRGRNFIDSSQLQCKFDNITTLGYRINNDYMHCISPPYHTPNTTVNIQLTNNLHVWTDISSSFTLLSSCD